MPQMFIGILEVISPSKNIPAIYVLFSVSVSLKGETTKYMEGEGRIICLSLGRKIEFCIYTS